MGRPKKDDEARFWSHVQKAGPDDCWNWTGGTRGLPGYHYGVIMYHGRREGAHRASWMIHHGPIDGDWEVMHSCDNRLCVNPAHLSLGSHKRNMQDAALKKRTRFGGRHHYYKLNAEEVLEIRRLSEQGATAGELAARFDITRQHVGVIIRREVWRGLDS